MPVSVRYARVSKQDGSQNLDLQVDALLKAGVSSERIYSDLCSGRKDVRPGLDLLDELKRKGIGLKVLTGNSSQIDTTTQTGDSSSEYLLC